MHLVIAAVIAVSLILNLYAFTFRTTAVLTGGQGEVTLYFRVWGHDLTLFHQTFNLIQNSSLQKIPFGSQHCQVQDSMKFVRRMTAVFKSGRKVEVKSIVHLTTENAAATALLGTGCGILSSLFKKKIERILPEDSTVAVVVNTTRQQEQCFRWMIKCSGKIPMVHLVLGLVRE